MPIRKKLGGSMGDLQDPIDGATVTVPYFEPYELWLYFLIDGQKSWWLDEHQWSSHFQSAG